MSRNISDIFQTLRALRANIKVKTTFPEQVKQIDRLLGNDKTGIVSTIVDFKIHAATVPMKIETKNEPLNKLLQNWQKRVLNRKVNIDIPSGLRALSKENYHERWRSSLLALKVIWGEEKFENQKPWIVPKKMWFLDGSSVITEATGALNTRKFFLKAKGKDNPQLKNTLTESIFIRKPFTSWHKDKVVPYLTQRGTVFNALMKNAITQKQSDVIEAILPILLKLQAGNDQLALEGLSPSEEDFKKLKDKIVNAKEKFEESGNFGDIIASLRHDVNLDYLIPDLTKIFDDKIVRSTDRNLLSSLGLIELQGFSSTRQEAILNPKVLVEEVTDGVMDWADLLEDVMSEMLERNKARHPTLANGEIRVIPGIIKSFITDDMRAMLRSLYDRGVLSKQDGVEDITGLDFEVQVERREKENKRNLQKTMQPPVIQNLEQYIDPELNDNNKHDLENENKNPGTPEADNFNNAILKYYTKFSKQKNIAKENPNIINTPEELPEDIKKLSLGEQLKYFMTYNCAIDYDKKSAEEAHKLARESIGLLVKKDTVLTQCQSCKFEFNYASIPEVSMGVIECPNCNTIIDQTGKCHAKTAKKIEVMAPYNNIDDLPDNVKNVLPPPAQLIFLRVFNSILKDTSDEDRARKGAWSAVKKKFKKDPDKKKWVKKATLEDYKDQMSTYAYKYFEDIYDTAIENESSDQSALKTALAIVEKVCIKNKNGVWVKDKKITKEKLRSLKESIPLDDYIDLQLKEKKIKLLDKLLKEDK